MLHLVVAALLALADPIDASEAASSLVGTVGQCDPVDGPPLVWTAEAREETRARVQATCRAVGASRAVCAWLDASVVRESDGAPGVRHTRASGEWGLGPLGLSLRWHMDKWPGGDEDPAFCSPEASTLVALEIAHRAWTRYEARSLVLVQSIYGGRWRCYHDADTTERRCFATQIENPRLCAALGARDVDCHEPLHRRDLGRRVPLRDRRALAERLASDFIRNRSVAHEGPAA
jgi:hypothetical protein